MAERLSSNMDAALLRSLLDLNVMNYSCLLKAILKDTAHIHCTKKTGAEQSEHPQVRNMEFILRNSADSWQVVHPDQLISPEYGSRHMFLSTKKQKTFVGLICRWTVTSWGSAHKVWASAALTRFVTRNSSPSECEMVSNAKESDVAMTLGFST